MYFQEGKSGGFQHRVDYQPLSLSSYFLPLKELIITWKNWHNLNSCSLFHGQSQFTEHMQKSPANKREDTASVSAAGSAHISGPAGLKTTESHRGAEQKSPLLFWHRQHIVFYPLFFVKGVIMSQIKSSESDRRATAVVFSVITYSLDSVVSAPFVSSFFLCLQSLCFLLRHRFEAPLSRNLSRTNHFYVFSTK